MAHLARSRTHRSLVVTLLGVALLTFLSACGNGMYAQTNQPYTPAEGVNFNVGPTGQWVQVRNLMILSRGDGEGFLSGSIVANDRDAMTAVAGTPFKADGTAGAPFEVTMPNPVGLSPGLLVVLTDRAFITLKSADLIVGGEAEVTLSFSTVGEYTTRVPVVDADQEAYQSLTPSPAPSS